MESSPSHDPNPVPEESDARLKHLAAAGAIGFTASRLLGGGTLGLCALGLAAYGLSRAWRSEEDEAVDSDDFSDPLPEENSAEESSTSPFTKVVEERMVPPDDFVEELEATDSEFGGKFLPDDVSDILIAAREKSSGEDPGESFGSDDLAMDSQSDLPFGGRFEEEDPVEFEEIDENEAVEEEEDLDPEPVAGSLATFRRAEPIALAGSTSMEFLGHGQFELPAVDEEFLEKDPMPAPLPAPVSLLRLGAIAAGGDLQEADVPYDSVFEIEEETLFAPEPAIFEPLDEVTPEVSPFQEVPEADDFPMESFLADEFEDDLNLEPTEDSALTAESFEAGLEEQTAPRRRISEGDLASHESELLDRIRELANLSQVGGDRSPVDPEEGLVLESEGQGGFEVPKDSNPEEVGTVGEPGIAWKPIGVLPEARTTTDQETPSPFFPAEDENDDDLPTGSLKPTGVHSLPTEKGSVEAQIPQVDGQFPQAEPVATSAAPPPPAPAESGKAPLGWLLGAMALFLAVVAGLGYHFWKQSSGEPVAVPEVDEPRPLNNLAGIHAPLSPGSPVAPDSPETGTTRNLPEPDDSTGLAGPPPPGTDAEPTPAEPSPDSDPVTDTTALDRDPLPQPEEMTLVDGEVIPVPPPPAPPEIQKTDDPETALRAFLEAGSPEARLPWSLLDAHSRQQFDQAGPEFHQPVAVRSMKQVEQGRLEDTGLNTYLYHLETDQSDRPVPVMLAERDSGGLGVDWLAFVQEEQKLVQKFFASQSSDKLVAKVVLRRAAAIDPDLRAAGDFTCFQIQPLNLEARYRVYIPSDHPMMEARQWDWDVNYPVTVSLGRAKTPGGAAYATIEELLAPTWTTWEDAASDVD